MNLNNNARRAAALLTVPALLLTAAACGSDSEDGKADKSSASGDSSSGGSAVAKVSGKFGDKPKVSVEKDKKPTTKKVVKTLSEGDGKKVKKGDFVRMDVLVRPYKKNQPLMSTWAKPQPNPESDVKPSKQQAVAQVGGPKTAPNPLGSAKASSAIVGKKTGSRLLVQGSAKEMLGSNYQQLGVKADSVLMWVIDVQNSKHVDPKSEVKGDQADPEKDMPKVKTHSGKAASISVPKGVHKPKETKSQVLVDGDGKKVKKGDGLITQYTLVPFAKPDKTLDSSWKHGGASAFQIGTGMVYPAWDKNLVGKHVGDRVVMSVPPKDGAGKKESKQNPMGGKSLVFVVDVLGTV